MKTCYICKVSKPVCEFGVHKRRSDGLRGECKSCQSLENRKSYLKGQVKWQAAARIRVAEWRSRPGNAEKNRAAAIAWYASPKNSEVARKRSIEWSQTNPERRTATYRKWREANPGKAAALSKSYKLRKIHARPSWANDFFISEAYDIAAKRSAVTGINWDVDHIVPLRSAIVCGFHTEQNLQVIPHKVNVSKGNRYWPCMP